MKLVTALMIYLGQNGPSDQLKVAERVLAREKVPLSGLFCRDVLSSVSKDRLELKKQGHYKH